MLRVGAMDLAVCAEDLFVEAMALEAQFHSDRARPGRSEQSVLSFIASRSSFLIGELLLGKLSETVVVLGNAPHDRPSFLVGHLIGNRASFLCTKAPMLRIPETNFLQGITSISGRVVQADLFPPPTPPADPAKIRPGRPAPAMGPGTGLPCDA